MKSKISNKQIMEHVGLVHKAIKTWQWAIGSSLGYEDLEQAGLMGITRAIEKYDPEKGKFSTYAMKWIHHFIRRTVGGARIVKVSLQHSRESYHAGCPIPVSSVSLSPNPLEGSDEMEPIDGMVYTDADQVDSVYESTVKTNVQLAVDNLPPRQQQAIKLKYFSRRPLSNQDIATYMSISVVRVRQLLAEATINLKEEIDWIQDDE